MPELQRLLHATLPEALRAAAAGHELSQDIGHAFVPIYIFDAESHAILDANAAALRLYGYEAAEFLRLTLYDIRPPEEAERTRRFLGQGWPAGLRYSGAWRHRARDGRVFTVNAMGLGIVHQGRPAVLAMVTDLTQTLYKPAATGQADGSPLPFAELMDEVCWIRRADDLGLVYLNPAFERVYGLPREAAYADQHVVLSIVHQDDVEAVRRYIAFRSPGPARHEYRIRRPDGAVRWLASRCFPMVDAAGAPMLAGFVEDITERRQAELDRLAALEAQRDAVVREVHHRIKNSLQGVTGLLRRFAAAHPELASLLGEAAGQVQSVGMVHGLRGRAVAGRVKLCELVRLVATGAESGLQGQFFVDIPPPCDPCLAIREQDAVPLALMINELACNAVKHARGEGGHRLSLRIDPAEVRAELCVRNPGRLPDDFSPAGCGGSGLELIRLLLPAEGVNLGWRQTGDEVVASLSLDRPVLFPVPSSAVEHGSKSQSP